MNTNNAPEQKAVATIVGLYESNATSFEAVDYLRNYVAERIEEALARRQPKVSESDESVEDLIHRMWNMAINTCVLSEDNNVVVSFDIEKAAHVLREYLTHHCQYTAFTKEEMEEVCENTHFEAVSADAVDGCWYRIDEVTPPHEKTVLLYTPATEF